MRTLFVLEAVERLQRGFRHRRLAADGAEQLLAERDLPLLGQEARFGVADVAEHRVEPRAVELAGDALEARDIGDLPGDLGVADVEPQRARPLVEHGFGDHLAEQLAVEPQRLGLVGQDRAIQLAAELLQPVLVELAEGIDADLGAADLGDRGCAEAFEDVADAPDAEADGDQAEDDAHDGAADPIGGGFMNTSKHETVSCCLGERPIQGRFGRNIEAGAQHRNSRQTPLARLLALC